MDFDFFGRLGAGGTGFQDSSGLAAGQPGTVTADEYTLEQLELGFQISGYAPFEEGGMYRLGWHQSMVTEAEARGIDTSLWEIPTSYARVQSLNEAFSSLAGYNIGLRTGASQELAAFHEASQRDEEQRQRVRTIRGMEAQLADFLADDTYEKLLQQIDTLGPTFGEEAQRMVRNETARTVRLQEAQRLRRVGASLGLRGLGSHSAVGAHLALNSVAEADRLLADQFRLINQQGLETQRDDALQSLMLTESLTSQRRNAEIELRNRIGATQAGIPYMSSVAPTLDYTGFLQAMNAAELSRDLSRRQIQAAREGAYVQAGGEIIGGILGGVGGMI
jgi:hypothetical protein